MDIEYTGRQTTITKKLKTMAEAGLARVTKIVGSSCTVHVILTTEKYRQCAEITFKTRTYKLVAKCEATEMDVIPHYRGRREMWQSAATNDECPTGWEMTNAPPMTHQ